MAASLLAVMLACEPVLQAPVAEAIPAMKEIETSETSTRKWEVSNEAFVNEFAQILTNEFDGNEDVIMLAPQHETVGITLHEGVRSLYLDSEILHPQEHMNDVACAEGYEVNLEMLINNKLKDGERMEVWRHDGITYAKAAE